MLSAQVIFKPPEGELDEAVITAETLARYQPDETVVASLRKVFEEAGFEVSELIGISFSITASPELFEQTFGVKPDAQGQLPDGTYNLPLEPLDEDLRQHLAAISFSPPPDFGPGAFS